MNEKLKIGFIGFGEAGYHLAKGLRGAGVGDVSAYDINSHTPGLGERIRQRAKDSDVTLRDSSEALAAGSTLLFSTVTANASVDAAQQTAPFLDSQHLYVDFNSVSPTTKQVIAQIVAGCGAGFVEVAVMGNVSRLGHRVPALLGGANAGEFKNQLEPYGMRLEVVNDQVGAAITVKMCRSIVVKGLEALLFECVLAATRYGADERVFASLEESFPGMNWSKLAGYMVSRVIEHGERRAREMDEVAATLRAIGIEPIMAEATSRRQEWGAGLGLREYFGDEVPEDYRAIVAAIAERGI